ncbi:MAG TPA: radical SAM protein [Candidatus Margulisiibacteriota bacterium]|nr:radical SAM protein [Candidatus Margulisiibacteriota bacterium]
MFNNPRHIRSLHINCDGSLTCNCNDSLGLGKLGNVLTEASFSSIWNNAKAVKLRNAFIKNRIPLIICPTCRSFKILPAQACAGISSGVQLSAPKIRDLNIENTVLCNYNCGGCNRKAVYSLRGKDSLSLEDFQVIFSVFDGVDIESIGLHNLGEPSLHKEFAEQLKLVRERRPHSTIFFSTNGSFVNNDKIREAIVRYVDHIHFSIDGTDQKTAQIYQVGIDFDQVVENLRNLVIFRDASGNKRLEIYWKCVLFWWNDRNIQIEKLIRMAREIKVDGIYFTKAKNPLFCNPVHWIWKEKMYKRRFHLVTTEWGDLVLRLNLP